MNKKTIISLTILVVLVIAIVGIYFTQKKKEPEVIKIGAILPLTGSGAELGSYSLEGLLLGIDDLNNEGGVLGKKVELIIEDSKSSEKDGVMALQKMLNLNPDVKVIFSQLSGVSVALSKFLKDKKIIHFGMAATDEFIKVSPYNVRNYLSSERIAEIAAVFVKENLSTDRVGLLYMQSEYSHSIAKFFTDFSKKNGIEVISESFPSNPQTTDLKNLIVKFLGKLGNEKPIFLTGYGPSLGIIVKHLNIVGYNGILIVEPTFNFPYVLDMAKDSKFLIKLIDIAFSNSKPYSIGQKIFSEKFKNKYGKEPKLSAVLAYETLFLWASIVNRINSFEPNFIISNMESLGVIEGKVFDQMQVKERDIKFPLAIKNIKGGEIKDE